MLLSPSHGLGPLGGPLEPLVRALVSPQAATLAALSAINAPPGALLAEKGGLIARGTARKALKTVTCVLAFGLQATLTRRDKVNSHSTRLSSMCLVALTAVLNAGCGRSSVYFDVSTTMGGTSAGTGIGASSSSGAVASSSGMSAVAVASSSGTSSGVFASSVTATSAGSSGVVSSTSTSTMTSTSSTSLGVSAASSASSSSSTGGRPADWFAP